MMRHGLLKIEKAPPRQPRQLMIAKTMVAVPTHLRHSRLFLSFSFGEFGLASHRNWLAAMMPGMLTGRLPKPKMQKMSDLIRFG